MLLIGRRSESWIAPAHLLDLRASVRTRHLLSHQPTECQQRIHVDARAFAADGRSYDLVTTHFLHPPAGGMVDVTRRLSEAVEPGGHLLVVGHAPSEVFTHLTASQHRAMFLAQDLLRVYPTFSKCSWLSSDRER